MRSFLKWLGSKREQREILSQKIPKNFNTYFEPFCGGGSLFLHLGLANTVINDVNTQLINCYKQVRDNVDDFIYLVKKIDNVEVDNNYYFKQREKYNNKILNDVNDLECAALLYWLNKRCFNGLYRINKKGLFNASWNKSTNEISIDEENLKEISKYLKGIKIYNKDFEEICKLAKKNDFVYIDSPYVPLTDSAKFTNYNADGFSKQDHHRLAKAVHDLTKKQVYVMLSNHNVKLVKHLYSAYNFMEIKASRKINTDATNRTGVSEVIITNY